MEPSPSPTPPAIQPDFIIVSFSGGKDSTAMLAYLAENYPAATLIPVMADTGFEHPGAVQWSRRLVSLFNLPLIVCRNQNKDFFSMVRKRKKFPSAQYRQCTSDLKRDPINKVIRRQAKEHGQPVIINALGIRAEESRRRSKMQPWKLNKRLTTKSRTVYDWYPIFDWTQGQVDGYLADRDLPVHPVYNYLPRFSCQLCIMMRPENVAAVKKHTPKVIKKIAQLEREIDFTMFDAGPIEEIAARGAGQLTLNLQFQPAPSCCS